MDRTILKIIKQSYKCKIMLPLIFVDAPTAPCIQLWRSWTTAWVHAANETARKYHMGANNSIAQPELE